MTDFETHSRGTTEEIRLSRALVAELKELVESHGEGILYINVLNAYKALIKHHERMIQLERE